jgi:predicted GIY-YIG superfamily endonuclease
MQRVRPSGARVCISLRAPLDPLLVSRTMWFVYVLRCSDQTLYTGITTDTDRRLAEHNEGRGARYTRSRGPVALVYIERAPDRASALQREYEIKRMKAAEKREMVAKQARGRKTRRRRAA